MKQFAFLLTLLILLINLSFAQVKPLKQRAIQRLIPLNTTVTPGPTGAVIQSCNWWKYIIPTNVNNFSAFSNISPSNYDAGIDALMAAIKGTPSFQKLLITGTNITAARRQKLPANGISFVY
ncbi:MAG: hypothetical protein Q8941_16795 [Bacteroidota bacterium]|nr:hypothetical protein [Bacteroidota bacterium]